MKFSNSVLVNAAPLSDTNNATFERLSEKTQLENYVLIKMPSLLKEIQKPGLYAISNKDQLIDTSLLAQFVITKPKGIRNLD